MTYYTDALIIGGGVIGGAIALELAKQGTDCTVLEKGAFSSEASTASAGMLCPQAEMFQPKMEPAIFLESMKKYQNWTKELENISNIPVQRVQEGMIRVVFSDEEKEKIKKTLSSADSHGTWVNPEEIHNMEPSVTKENKGGVYFPEDGQLHPIHLAKSIYTALKRLGSNIEESTPALSLITENNRVLGARTSNGDFFAEYTIVAAGAWTSSLLSPLGLHLPVFPVKGQMIAAKAPSLNIQKTVQGLGSMILPRQDGTLTLGVTIEDTGFNKEPTIDGVSRIYQTTSQLIPELERAKFLTTWAGLRPGTPDGIPYIGEFADYDGLMVAAGHYSIGILLAPITAKTILQMINGEHIDRGMKPFLPSRFQHLYNSKIW